MFVEKKKKKKCLWGSCVKGGEGGEETLKSFSWKVEVKPSKKRYPNIKRMPKRESVCLPVILLFYCFVILLFIDLSFD